MFLKALYIHSKSCYREINNMGIMMQNIKYKNRHNILYIHTHADTFYIICIIQKIYKKECQN